MTEPTLPEYAHVRLVRHDPRGHVVELVLDRPEAHNALSTALAREIAAAWLSDELRDERVADTAGRVRPLRDAEPITTGHAHIENGKIRALLARQPDRFIPAGRF